MSPKSNIPGASPSEGQEIVTLMTAHHQDIVKDGVGKQLPIDPTTPPSRRWVDRSAKGTLEQPSLQRAVVGRTSRLPLKIFFFLALLSLFNGLWLNTPDVATSGS
jgi:hypothetical protein